MVDMFDDSVVVRFYSYLDNSCKLLRIKYSVAEDGCIVLGDCNEVHVVYEDIPAEKCETPVDKQTQEQESGTSSFTNCEGEILTDSHKEEKIKLINSYQEYLDKEELIDFTSSIEKYTVNELERELLKKYKNYQEKHCGKKTMRAFSLNSLKTNTSVDTLDSFVRMNLGK